MASKTRDSSYAARKAAGSIILAALIAVVLVSWAAFTVRSIRRTALTPLTVFAAQGLGL